MTKKQIEEYFNNNIRELKYCINQILEERMYYMDALEAIKRLIEYQKIQFHNIPDFPLYLNEYDAHILDILKYTYNELDIIRQEEENIIYK